MSPYYAHAPLGQASAPPVPPPTMAITTVPATYTLWSLAGLAAGAALAWHGYRRSGSVGWALAWAIGGGMVWPVAIAIAVAQGFGKPAHMRSNRGRRRRRSRSR